MKKKIRVKVVLENTFHNTEISVLAELRSYAYNKVVLHITGRQVKMADKRLCGMDCECGGFSKARLAIGGEELEIFPAKDGYLLYEERGR